MQKPAFPHQAHHEPEFPPALRTAGRVLAALAGVLAGAAMLVAGGLYALLSTCVDHGGAVVCSDLVDTLDIVTVLIGAAAATGGGVATAATGRARWVAAGLATAITMTMLLSVLVGAQVAALN